MIATVIVGLGAALAPTLAVIVSHRLLRLEQRGTRTRVEEVRVIVNGRLDRIIDENIALRKQLVAQGHDLAT